MKNFRSDKKTKRKGQWTDYKKKRNILRRWLREQANRKKDGLPLKQMPVEFPKNRK